MSLDKQTRNDIMNDIQQDINALSQRIASVSHETWGDETQVQSKDIMDLLYRIKVIEQRLKYLGGYHY
jgi:cob(I)alamin adenosyltransferase